MREKRDEVIILRLTKTEKHRIYEKMLGMGIRSLSAYISPKEVSERYCLMLKTTLESQQSVMIGEQNDLL